MPVELKSYEIIGRGRFVSFGMFVNRVAPRQQGSAQVAYLTSTDVSFMYEGNVPSLFPPSQVERSVLRDAIRFFSAKSLTSLDTYNVMAFPYLCLSNVGALKKWTIGWAKLCFDLSSVVVSRLLSGLGGHCQQLFCIMIRDHELRQSPQFQLT